MAMAAAQAAAEKALREARDREQANNSSHPRGGQMNNQISEDTVLFGGDNRYLESLQATDLDAQQSNLMQELLGLQMNGNGELGSADQLLQMLAQQQQQGQPTQFSGAPEPMFDTRPREHYLTIAQNGMSV